MFALSSTPIAAEYAANMRHDCTLNGVTVTVRSYTNESRSGSSARGFKFSSNTYGILIRQHAAGKFYTPPRFSPDHGKTWYETFAEMKKQRTGKVKLAHSSSKEFAFDSIQKINKSYDPGYA